MKNGLGKEFNVNIADDQELHLF